MAMLAAEGADVGASAVSGTTSSGDKFSPGQKTGALSRALPKPRTHHPYIVGITLMAVGAFALVGSITGTLPSMIAALFVPNALVDTGGNLPIGLQQFLVNTSGSNATQGATDAAAILLAGQ